MHGEKIKNEINLFFVTNGVIKLPLSLISNNSPPNSKRKDTPLGA